jgi:hypothetical protein
MKFKSIAKKVLMIISLIALGQVVLAQKFNVNWSDKQKLTFEYDDAVVLANGKNILLKKEVRGGSSVFGIGGKVKIKYTLVLADKNMSVLKESEVEIEEKNSVLKGFEKFGNNVFFIYSSYDKSTKNTTITAQKINEETLGLSSVSTIAVFESDSKSDQATASFWRSSDSTKVMLFSEGPERKKENKKIYFTILDNDLKKIWSKDTELPMLDKYCIIYDFDMSNDGKVYVAVKQYDKEVSRESVRRNSRKVPSYVYKMFIYDQKVPAPKEITFNLNDNFVHGTKIAFNKSGAITVAGLYKKKYSGNLTGAFYATIDPLTNAISNPKMVEFPIEMLTLVDKDNFGSDKKSDPGLYDEFRIRNILTRPDGSVDLVSEYYDLDIVTRTSNSGSGVSFGTTRTDYYYYYGDIINSNISKDGKATFTRIPKNQKAINTQLFLGIYSFIHNNNLVILYNDDKDNVDRDLSKAPDDIMKFKNSVLVAATVNSKGDLNREAIFSNDDDDYITIPRSFIKATNNSYIIVADLFKVFKRRTKYGILTVK